MRIDDNKNVSSKSFRDNNTYVSNSVKKGRYHNNYTTVISTKNSNGLWTSTTTNTRELNKRGIFTIVALIVSFLLLFTLIDDIYNQGVNSQKYTFTGLLNFLRSFSQKNWTLDLSFISIPQITAEWVGFEWLKNFFNTVIGSLNSAVSFVSLAINMLLTVLRFMYMLSNYIFNTTYAV